MAYSDNVTLFQQRLAANLPQASLSNQTVLMNLATAFLSADADTQYLVQSIAPNMFLATSSGAALDQKALDYNVTRFLGLQATAQVFFYLPNNQNASATTTFPVGTVVATPGDGVTTISQLFTTMQVATLSSGTNTSNSVTVVASNAGVSGNVLVGQISIVQTAVGAGTYLVTNPAAAVGGTDPDSDAVLRQKCYTSMSSKYSLSSVANAILSVPGVYDTYIYDPQDGSGHITYYWCDVNGTQALASPSAVAQAVSSVLPPTMGALATSAAFTVINFTAANAINVSYNAPAAISGSSSLNLSIQQAVVNYIQGTATTQGLLHNQAPSQFGMSQFVNLSIGGLLTNFILNNTTPGIGAPSQTTIYRAVGGPSVVTVANNAP